MDSTGRTVFRNFDNIFYSDIAKAGGKRFPGVSDDRAYYRRSQKKSSGSWHDFNFGLILAKKEEEGKKKCLRPYDDTIVFFQNETFRNDAGKARKLCERKNSP